MPNPSERRNLRNCSCLLLVTVVTCVLLLYISQGHKGERKENAVIQDKYAAQSERLVDEECIPTCFTPECVLHANLLNSNMEPNFDQCEDFYSFSCAKFEKKFGKDENKSIYGMLGYRIYMEIKDILDNLEADPDSASGKMKMVYDSCMNTRSSELDAVTSTLEFFQILGVPNWPNLPSDFEFTEPKLSTVLGTLAAYRENAFFKISFRPSGRQYRHQTSVECDTSIFNIPKNDSRILKYFNLNEKDIIQSVHKFWNPLSILKTKFNTCENITDNFYLNCSQAVPQQWRMLCEIVETFVDVTNGSHMISKNEIFIFCDDVGLVEMLLNLTSEMPHRVLVDLLVLSVFKNHMDDLSFHFRLGGKDWKHCVRWAIKNMVFSLGREYIKNVLSEEVLIQVQDVSEECSREIKELITSQNWLTDVDKSHILAQLQQPTSTELMLKYYLNETFVNNYYSQFHPTPKSFMKNVLERQRNTFTTDIALLQDSSPLYSLKPFKMNASFQSHLIVIGFGFLRFPAFIRDQPRILNLIRLAIPFGHELGHGINRALDISAKYNASAKINFIERVRCIHNQYSNFTLESIGKHVRAYWTKKENHADAIAIILIDKLLKKYDVDETTYSLPSLPYTTKELVYIIYTELTCEKTTKEDDKYKLEIDPHPHNRFRITAVMQNSKSFSRVFNCTEGSYMNPKYKCSLLDLE